jgi:hypothetical protein
MARKYKLPPPFHCPVKPIFLVEVLFQCEAAPPGTAANGTHLRPGITQRGTLAAIFSNLKVADGLVTRKPLGSESAPDNACNPEPNDQADCAFFSEKPPASAPKQGK